MPAAIRDADESSNVGVRGWGKAVLPDDAAGSGHDGRSAHDLVSLITRVGCTLCVEAEHVVDQVCASHHVGWRRLDVDADPGLAQFSDHVPVLLIDGIVISYWFVDAAELGRRLDALAASAAGGTPTSGEEEPGSL